MSRLRPRFTYANVMATLAMFVALGGGVYAATKITGKDIKKNSVPGADLKKNSVKGKQIKDGKLTGVDLGANSVTGAQIDESSLEVTRIVARPAFAGSIAGDSTPDAVPLTDNAWTAKAGEIDALAGYVEIQPNAGCPAFPTGQVTVSFRVGDKTIATAGSFGVPTSDNRYPIVTGGFLPTPTGTGPPGIPDADEARTLTAEVSGFCVIAPDQPGGTLTAIRAGVIANR